MGEKSKGRKHALPMWQEMATDIQRPEQEHPAEAEHASQSSSPTQEQTKPQQGQANGRPQIENGGWQSLGAVAAKSKLEKAGWRGPVAKPKEVVAPLDPLLLLLKQHEDQLPDAIKTAVQEATQIPELAVGKKAQQSSRELGKASSRLKVDH